MEMQFVGTGRKGYQLRAKETEIHLPKASLTITNIRPQTSVTSDSKLETHPNWYFTSQTGKKRKQNTTAAP